MAADKAVERKTRLAQELKKNLKRRKNPAIGESEAESSSSGLGPGSGVAPQGGLKPMPSRGPKTASKRN